MVQLRVVVILSTSRHRFCSGSCLPERFLLSSPQPPQEEQDTNPIEAVQPNQNFLNRLREKVIPEILLRSSVLRTQLPEDSFLIPKLRKEERKKGSGREKKRREKR